jgi:hypothetical protein
MLELQAPPLAPLDSFPGLVSAHLDDRAARRSLRDQIVRLEGELCRAITGEDPPSAVATAPPSGAAADPRMLDLGALERVRDELAERLSVAGRQRASRARLHAANRRRVEAMMRDPAAHRFQSISYKDVGERGCGGWEVRPRLGPVGLLMGWWRVKISSGCPLAGRREGAATRYLGRFSRLGGRSSRRATRPPSAPT